MPVITHVAECLVDISFVVDYSGSIEDTNPPPPARGNWEYVIEFMVEVVSRINIGESATHVAAVSFGA